MKNSKPFSKYYKYPRSVFVEISRVCNFKCIMCNNQKISNSTNNKFIKNELFFKIADKLFNKASYIDLHGFGEPTLHPEFKVLIEKCSIFESKFGIVTNLSSKDSEVWDLLCKNNFLIVGSFDSIDKNLFEKIRVNSRFEDILKNISYIMKLKKKYQNSQPLKLIMTIVSYNFNDMENVLDFAINEGISHIIYNYSISHPDTDFNINKIDHKDIQKKEAQLKNKAMNLNVNIFFNNRPWFHSRRIIQKKKCEKPWDTIYITNNGDIGACNHHLDPIKIKLSKHSQPEILGNLWREPFENIWNGEKYNLFRETTGNGDPIDPVCELCYYFKKNYSDGD